MDLFLLFAHIQYSKAWRPSYRIYLLSFRNLTEDLCLNNLHVQLLKVLFLLHKLEFDLINAYYQEQQFPSGKWDLISCTLSKLAIKCYQRHSWRDLILYPFTPIFQYIKTKKRRFHCKAVQRKHSHLNWTAHLFQILSQKSINTPTEGNAPPRGS